MAAAQIDFWFTMGSTYSFLSVMRLGEIEKSSGVAFRWRPFHLLVILQEMNHVPFADKPAKSAYMWRDIERRAAMYGIPARLPGALSSQTFGRRQSGRQCRHERGLGRRFRARRLSAL